MESFVNLSVPARVLAQFVVPAVTPQAAVYQPSVESLLPVKDDGLIERFMGPLTVVCLTVSTRHGWKKEVAPRLASQLFYAFRAKAVLLGDSSLEASLPLKLDLVWHELLLDTRLYRTLCDQAFNTFLHHDPHTEGDANLEKRRLLLRDLWANANPNVPIDEWVWADSVNDDIIERPRRFKKGRIVKDNEEERKVSSIYVKGLEGKTHEIFGDLADLTVINFKRVVSFKVGTCVDSQRLIFSGLQLDNSRTLKSYNINGESTIHLVLRLCGC